MPKGTSQPCRFPGSIIFARVKNISHSHLYRVLTGERESVELASAYRKWARENNLPIIIQQAGSKHTQDQSTFAGRLKSEITKAGINAQKLSKRLGVTHVCIGNMLNGRNEASARIALKMARLFGCDIGWLIEGVPLANPQPETSRP